MPNHNLSSTLSITSIFAPSPTPTPTPPPPKEPSHTFHIDISNQRQHVGAWYGTFIRDDTLDFLDPLCSRDKSGQINCKLDSNNGTNVEHADVNEKWKVVRMRGVRTTLKSFFFPPDAPEDLHKAFIAQIADTYMIATLSDGNCFKFDRTSTICVNCNKGFCPLIPGRGQPADNRGRIIRWCNAPEYVRVSVTDAEGKETAHMEVRLQFGADTEMGKLDCVGIIDAVDANAKAERAKGLEKGLRDKVEVVVACSSKEVTGSCANEECLYNTEKCGK